MEKGFTDSFLPHPAVSKHPSLTGHRFSPTPSTIILVQCS